MELQVIIMVVSEQQNRVRTISEKQFRLSVILQETIMWAVLWDIMMWKQEWRTIHLQEDILKNKGTFVGGYVGLNASKALLEDQLLVSNPNVVTGEYCVSGIIGGSISNK
ncbi:MAG: hypothetical protein ACLRMZ_00485 [Blautia marasmi]